MSLTDILFICLLLSFIIVCAGISGYVLEKQEDDPTIIFTAIGTVLFSFVLVSYVSLIMNDFVRELYIHDVPLTKHQASIVIKKDYFDVNKPIIFKEETNHE